ncbi:AAA family ATPase [Halalkalibacterium halodurans]|uniref:AAA family ATPase n=1 Tax=Halalkalibacterium halodurans TaxID=86665 RepID=UPI0006A99CA4|nr:AAA family ATPase [Halalkalibacterium halodurans]MDY7222929.1 AAA family ATPase [Halalkalibacterium halodurans]MDY7242150.1 AAA family ATPase [Halalkalibacterium halodurans]MED3646242.1 AAA family ATPase [Halalkalibacterium halodurans]TPE69565.1 hypothetical protein AMD02_007250 [Halalkalibacterium halodurans]
MSTINQVRLENFQSHLDTVIEFGEGMNVIVGESDSGKTSILRAIRWALFNLPRGTDFMRAGADFVRVRVTFTDGTTIVRERTPSKNRYVIKRPEEEDLILEGFGIHVPQEVLDAHGMKPLRIDRDHEIQLHVAQQLDGPFLLDQTGAIRAKAIGRISGAHFLDMAIRDTTKDLSRLNQKMKYDEEEAQRIEGELLPFQSLDLHKRKLEQAEQKMNELHQLEEKKKKLMEFERALEQQREQQAHVRRQLTRVQHLEEWIHGYERIQAALSRLTVYRQFHRQLGELKTQVTKCHLWIQKTNQMALANEQLNRMSELKGRLEVLSKHKRYWDEQERVKHHAFAAFEKTSFVTTDRIVNFHKLQAYYERKQHLDTIYRRWRNYEQERIQWQEKKDQSNGAVIANEQIGQLNVQLEKLGKLKELQQQVEHVRKRMDDGQAFLHKTKQELIKLEHDHHQLLLQEGTCPTCGQAIRH